MPTNPPVTTDAQALAQWRQLRPLPGHFSGGSWRDTVDRWGGPKHQALRQLSARLVQQRARLRQVQAWLGPADARQPAGAPLPEGLAEPCAAGLPLAPGQQRLHYHWRGTHDQLLLAVQGGRVVGCAWLYAQEQR